MCIFSLYKKSKMIIADSIQRYAGEYSAENSVSVVNLPDVPARLVTPVHWIGLVGLGVGLSISCVTGWRYTVTLRGKTV